MALPKKIQGALALTSPTEDEATDYNAEMKALKGQLVQTPDEISSARTLAWAGGLTDPGGNGDLGSAFINGVKSMSDYDHKDRQLRAQYIPMIMTALATQQQNAQLARMAQNTLAGGGTGNDLIGMDPNKLPAFAQATGQKLSDVTTLWKEANKPDAMQTNTFQRFPKSGGGFDERFIGDPTKGVAQDSKGNVFNMPGAVGANAAMAGAQSVATERGKRKFDFVEGVAPDGTPYKIPLEQLKPEWFGDTPQVPSPQPPQGGAPTPAPTQGGAPPQGGGMPPPPMGARPPAGVQAPQPRNSAGIDPSQWRGAFEGNPQNIAASISAIRDPVQREQAMAAYENQMRGKNPAYVPDGSEAPANPMQGQPPVAKTGVPPGAIQTGIDPVTLRKNQNVTQGNELFQTKLFPQVLEQGGRQADIRIQSITQASDALRRIGDTGWGAETKADMAKVLGAMGVQNAEKFATNNQNFVQAVEQNNFKGLSEENKGVATEGDAMRYARTFASLGKTKAANELVLDTARAIAERDKRKADYYRQALPIANQQGGDLMEVERRWSAKAPSIIDMPSMRRWKKQWDDTNGNAR